MEALNKSICLRVVGGSRMVFDTPDLHKLGPRVGEELRTLVGRNCTRDAERCKPAVSETVDNRFGCYVAKGNCLGPTRKAVHDRQQIWETVGCWDRCDVGVQMTESTGWDDELADRRDGVAAYFGSGAVKTLARPFRRIAAK